MNVERLINRIICGYQYITFKGVVYRLANPSTDIKVAADNLYDSIYEDNLFSNFILKENIDQLLIDNDIISSTFDDDVRVTEGRLEDTKIKLYKFFSLPKEKQKHKRNIASLSKILNKAYSDKQSLDFLTLEHFCTNIKNEYIISQTLYDSNNNLVFENYPDIDHIFFNNIAQLIASEIITVTLYKEIARSDMWRKIYSAGNHNIFPTSASEYTEEQKAILSISRMYDRVYEHPESPDESIIEDDDALDGWMLHQQKENKRQKKEKGVSKGLGKAQNADEVFVMAEGAGKEEFASIMSLNSKQALNKMDARTTGLEKGQSLRDGQFEDTQSEIRSKLRELNKKSKGK